ncbi:MAG: tetratricopeptide repeat protein [Alphaproteobacteria bacterium]|nr:tetratricopeptide repeat protein [Alphaproteobacteria bacterium]
MTKTRIPLGPFVLSKKIGVGGGGEVWQGVHSRQGVPVAVKVITADRARDEKYHLAFENEVRAVAGLDHPGIVTVLDYGLVDGEAEQKSKGTVVAGSPYLAMELAERGSLRQCRLPGSFEDLRLWLLWLLDILGHAHAQGVIHRDLKPGNVLVFDQPSVAGDADGASRLRLTDFGLAHATDGGSVLKGTAGTPIFMAPEQFRGRWREFGPSTDLYALGCMAYTLAAGATPFRARDLSGLMQSHLAERAPPLVASFPVPPGFDGWLRRLMHKKPERRFQRAADAAHALVSLGEPGEGLGFEGVLPAESRRTWSPPTTHAPSDALVETATEMTLQTDATVGTQTQGTQGTQGATVDVEVEVPELDATMDETEDDYCPRVLPPLPSTWRAELPHRPSMQLVGAGLGLYGLRSVPLVARREERTELWSALSEVRSGGGTRVVVLRGRSGTGKSRLAQWLCRLADSVGSALVVKAGHSPGGGPADGLGRMMGQVTRCVGLERDPAGAWLVRWLRARGIFDGREARALQEVIAPRGGEEPMLASANERHALVQRVLAAVARSHTDGREPRPVLLWLDDVQWGQDSLGLVQWLLGHGSRLGPPMMVVMTVQDEALPSRPVEAERLAAIEAEEAVRTVKVGPLSPKNRTILVQELLHLEGELAEQVEKRTQGNPLFAVQLVGDWVRRGVLEVGATGFVLRPGERAVIPDDIHELWAARVERVLEEVGQDQRPCLELAAILGTDVDDSEWSGACRVAGFNVSAGLIPSLVRHGLARRGDDDWSFSHGMLRESLERSARESGRFQGLHRACATTLQIRWDANPQRGLAERLGRHLALGGREEEALGPLLAGARERRAMSDYTGALGVLDRRDKLLDDVNVPPTDPRRGEGWVARADVLICMGRLEEAEGWANRVVEVGRRKYWEALMAPALRHAAIASGKRGLFTAAQRRLSRAIEAAHFGGNEREAARCRLFLGEVARLQGAYEEAAGHCRQALSRFKALDDRRGQGEAYNALAGVCLGMGQLEQAERYCRAAIERFDDVGARFGVASAQNSLGDVLRATGEVEAASREYEHAETGLRALGSPEYRVPMLNRALLDIQRERWTEARDALLPLLDDMKRARRAGLIAVCHTALLPCFAASNDWRTFAKHLAAAQRQLRDTQLVDPDIARCMEIAAGLCKRGGNADAARTTAEIAFNQWRTLGRLRELDALRRDFGVG